MKVAEERRIKPGNSPTQPMALGIPHPTFPNGLSYALRNEIGRRQGN